MSQRVYSNTGAVMNLYIEYGSFNTKATKESIRKHLDIYPYITLSLNGKCRDFKNKKFNKKLNIIKC